MSNREMTDPDVIYLAPKCCPDPEFGRCWAADDEWPLDPGDEINGHEPATRYVRADIVRESTYRDLQEALANMLRIMSSGVYRDSAGVKPSAHPDFDEAHAVLARAEREVLP